MVTVAAPFTIKLYDKTFQWVGVLGDPSGVTLFPRHNAQPTGQVVIPNDHRLMTRIENEGLRFTVDFQGEQIMSGVIDSIQGDGDPDGNVTLQLRDDYGLIADILGYQSPTATIGTSTSTTLPADYYTKSGPAETVLKSVIQANAVTRLGLPVTVAPDLGRGATISCKWRMHPIVDRLFPAWDDAGLGISVRQVGAGLVLDVYEGRTYPVPITRESGIVRSFDWEWAAPTITRIVAGGQGEGVARKFIQSIDGEAENNWGTPSKKFVRESFTDANDVDNDADLIARAVASRREGRRLTGLKLELGESTTVRYGTHLRVGDTITETLVGSPTDHVVTEAILNWSSADGFTAVPVVGDLETHGGVTTAYARALAKKLRNLGVR